MGGKKKKSKSNNKLDYNKQETNETSADISQYTRRDYIENSTPDADVKFLKRKHETSDFDEDHGPRQKKPKKKKNTLPTEPTDKKNKKSIRQMKKEKHAERQAAAEAVAKEQLKSQCLNYLSQWKHDKSNWKFMKAKQVWLFKNKFSTKLVPDSSWPILLEYFESAQGNIRNMLLADANKIIKQMDDWTEAQNGEKEANELEESETPTINKPDDTVYNRARSLIQCLQE